MGSLLNDALCLWSNVLVVALLAVCHILIRRTVSLTSGQDITNLLLGFFCVGSILYFSLQSVKKTLNMNNELLRTIDDLRQAERSKDEFMANISHEIRTPINTIIGLNEMNLREQVSAEVEENCINIQSASRLLLALINDILDLSKIESNGSGGAAVRRGGDAERTREHSLSQAHEKNLDFNLDISPELPSMLYGDDIRLRQIITNILTNAIKYTEKGSVTLRVSCERTGENRVRLNISVADTGIGIRKTDIPHLFDVFQRVDEKKTHAIEGTGLGLAICKNLVEMMDGEIHVDSVYQKGSVFTVSLEQGIVNAAPISGLSGARAGSGKRMNCPLNRRGFEWWMPRASRSLLPCATAALFGSRYGGNKRTVCITTDSICDLPPELLAQYEIKYTYYYVKTDQGRFCDGAEVSAENLLDYVGSGEGSARSEAPPVEEYETFFAERLREAEQVIHISAGDGVGKGYGNALRAAEGFDHVYVVDSGHLSSGMGILALFAAEFARQGKGAQEILDALKGLRKEISTTFIVPTADMMYQSGRISGRVRSLCDVFDLHPMLSLKDSKIACTGIFAGAWERAFRKYVRRCVRGKRDIDTRLLFLTHAGCPQSTVEEIKKEVGKYQKFEHIIVQQASAAISSNCGAGTFGLIYVRSGRITENHKG